MTTWTAPPVRNPVRVIVNGSAAVAALMAATYLVASTPDDLLTRVALAIYGVSLVALFSVSGLYHALPWSSEWKQRMRRLDHSAIFLFEAGTITPMAVIVLEGRLLVIVLTVLWGGVLAGIGMKLLEPTITLGRSVAIQNLVGWIAIVPIWAAADEIGRGAVVALLAGGTLYLLGMVCFIAGKPRLIPGLFAAHELFHVMVVTAAAIHFHVIATAFLPLAT